MTVFDAFLLRFEFRCVLTRFNLIIKYFQEWLAPAFLGSTLCHFYSVISTITATMPVEMTNPTGCQPMLPYP